MSTKFTKDGQSIIAGGSGMNDIKVFANKADTRNATFNVQFDLKSQPAPVYDIDVSSSEC